MQEIKTRIQKTFNTFQGQLKFNAFKQSIPLYFSASKTISLSQIDTSMQFQMTLFLSMLNKKYQRIKQSKQPSLHIQQKVISPIKQRKQKIITTAKCNEQVFNNFIISVTQTMNYIKLSTNLIKQYKQQIYQTVLAICGKQDKKTLFWRTQSTYTQEDIKRFGKTFEQEIYFMSYEDDNKTLKKDFIGENGDGIYILSVKEKFLYLYSKNNNSPTNTNPNENKQIEKSVSLSRGNFNKSTNKVQMKIVQKSQVPATEVEGIFTKKQHPYNDIRQSQKTQSQNLQMSIQNSIKYPSLDHEQQSQILKQSRNSERQPLNIKLQNQTNNPQKNTQLSSSKINNSPLKQSRSSIRNSQLINNPANQSRSSIADDSIIFITKVKCTNCQKIFSEIDCLYWGYSYYCCHCIEDITIDTSHIPQTIMDKFLRQRNSNSQKGSYNIPCPECSNITAIPNYNPVKKNKLFTCNLCTKTICIQHTGNIYNCLCFCPKCKNYTIYLQRLNVNFCQKCRLRYCFKCQKKSHSFCACICKSCLGQQSKQHQCQPTCHSCNNKPAKLRQCRCGLKICFGCYYGAMEKWKQGTNFPCEEGQYV